MRNKFITLLSLATLFACVSCTDNTDNGGDGTGPVSEDFERVAFDCLTMAQSLGTDFETFATQNASYEIPGKSTADKFVMGGYVDWYGSIVETSRSANSVMEMLTLTIEVDKDVYGNVGSICAVPDNSNVDKSLWEYYLVNYEKLNMGTWLGAKYNVTVDDGSSEGGVYQTVDETLNVVDVYDVDNLLVCAVFGVISGKAYAVPTFEGGRFKVQLVNNFLRLDYSALYELVGGDYQAFAAENYIIGSKMSLWGTYYFYCDYALDFAGYAFNCDVNTDEAQTEIKSFALTLDSKYSTDEQLEIWKLYAAGDASLKLGDFKEAYTSSFGTKGETFASAQEVLDYVETNGRPAGGFDPDIVVVYGTDKASLTITLKSLSLTMKIE